MNLQADIIGRCEVSIIIVSWNTADVTCNCVKSVVRNCVAHPMEVIVVDNDSSDGTADILQAEFPGITIIRNSENKGFAAANNDGFAVARGRYVLLLNSDTLVHDDIVAKVLPFADANPEIGVVGCRAFDASGRQQSTMIAFLTLQRLFWNLFIPDFLMRKTSLFGNSRYVGINLDEVHDIDVASGCFMLVRREVLDRVGGLDGDFFMYGEEMEWCFRIRRAGWRVTYFPGANYTHFGGVSASKCQSQMNAEMAKGQLLFLHKAYGPAKARIAALLMLVRDIPRAVVWCAIGLFARLRNTPFAKSARMSIDRIPFLFSVVVSKHMPTKMSRSKQRANLVSVPTGPQSALQVSQKVGS